MICPLLLRLVNGMIIVGMPYALTHTHTHAHAYACVRVLVRFCVCLSTEIFTYMRMRMHIHAHCGYTSPTSEKRRTVERSCPVLHL